MNKKINQYKLVTLFVSLFQIVVVGAFITLYLLNVWDLYDLVKPEYFAYVFLVLIFIDNIFLFSMLYSVSALRKKGDLRTKQVLGNDVEEAYNFAQMGMVTVDKEGVVLWQSNFLYLRGIDIVNQNIFEWNKMFENFTKSEGGYELTVNIGDNIYNVKYLRTAGVFVFLDITTSEKWRKQCENQATCVGIITIDNYQDIGGNDDDISDTIAKVKNEIIQYAKEHKMLLKNFKNDSYICVCTYEDLAEVENDGFSLLEKVKQITKDDQVQPTLSIGIGHMFPDVNKLYEMASNAVDIAMSRGGDQAVVNKYGYELAFFGGKTESISKRNRVHVRQTADSLVNLIERAGNVLIMGHTDMDMDALGAALGVYGIVRSCGIQANIVIDDRNIEKKTRTAMKGTFSKEEYSEIFVSNRDSLEKVKNSTLLIVVDVSRPRLTMCPTLLEKTKKVVVIDHHRRSEDFIESPVLQYVETGASSASEIVAEFIKYMTKKPKDFKISQTIATFMLAGIFLDTTFLKSKTTSYRTFEACMVLKDFGADNGKADEMLKDDFEEYKLINKVIGTMKTPYYGVVYCCCDDDDVVERTLLAKVANQCMQLKDIHVAFVIGRTGENDVRISARSDGSINVQVLIEKMNGGGHFSSAATLLKNVSIRQAEEQLKEVLDDYLTEAQNVQDVKGEE